MPFIEELPFDGVYHRPSKRTLDDTIMDVETMDVSDYIPPQVKRRRKTMSTTPHQSQITSTPVAKRTSDDIDVDYEPKRRKYDSDSNSMVDTSGSGEEDIATETLFAINNLSWLNSPGARETLLQCFKNSKVRFLLDNPEQSSRPEAILSLPPLLPSLEEFLPKLLHQRIKWKDEEPEIEDLGARIEEITDDEADQIVASTDQYTIHEPHCDAYIRNYVNDGDVEMEVDPDSGYNSWNTENQASYIARNPDDILTNMRHLNI